jgi:hypothetical protein
MRDVLSNVVHRHLLRSAGFALADSPAVPERAQRLTVRYLSEIEASIDRLAHGPSRTPLVGLRHALSQYDPSTSPDSSFERDFQFLLLLVAKELDAETLDTRMISDLTKRIVKHLSSV